MDGNNRIRSTVMIGLIFLPFSWNCPSRPEPPVTNPESCGIRGPGIRGSGNKIAGGSGAGRAEFPWQVGFIRFASPRRRSLKYWWDDNSEGDNHPFCGGALINSNTVISAAHCFYDKNLNFKTPNFKVTLGDWNVRSSSDGEVKVWWRTVTRLNNYNPETNDNDIAIIRLENHAAFNDWVKPICLPDPDTNYENKAAVATGWGNLYSHPDPDQYYHGPIRPQILQKVDLKTISNSECKISGPSYYGTHLTERMICAYNQGKGTCYGDSGGPLASKVGNSYVLVGITSFGGSNEGCGTYPSVYVRVAKYVGWIRTHIEGNRGNSLKLANSSSVPDPNGGDAIFSEVSVTNDKPGKP